ncbi:MAG: hypothetical protein IBX68_02770 [Dehalococcoidia bacterium]|nr:hypothetical protein [Dehalococcoidia bacterium]
MKSILNRGILITFSLGVLAFIIYFVLDIVSRVWRPVIMSLFHNQDLVIPLTIVFSVMVILFVGWAFSPNRMSNRVGILLSKVPVLNWFLGDGRIPQSARDMPGVLVRFSEGAYFIGALTGLQKMKSKDGQVRVMYKIYSPSAPVPWSGLPIIFVTREQVIPLKINFGEVYGITTSFGRNTRELIEELTFADETLDVVPVADSTEEEPILPELRIEPGSSEAQQFQPSDRR